MKGVRRAGWFLIPLLLLGCHAGRALDPRTVRFPAPQFVPAQPTETALSRGVPVFLLEDHYLPLVRIYLSFQGGSLHDPPDRAGLAAVTALAWRTGGAGELSPEAMDEALEGRGMRLSLSLGRERGSVSMSVMSRDLEQGLALLSQVLLTPTFRQDRLDLAVTQVSENIRREDDDPQGLSFRELRKALYRGHPRAVTATVESVARIRREDVTDLHRKLVESGSWMVGVVGDFNPDVLLAALEDGLGTLPGEGKGFPHPPPPPTPVPRLVLVPKDLPQTTIVWARFGASRKAPGFYPLELLDHAVGSGGFQARLVREIRSERGLAYNVGGFYQALPDFGVVGAYAMTKSESVVETTGLMRRVLETTAAEGLDQEELDRAKSALVNRHVFRYEDPANAVRERIRLLADGLPIDLPSRYSAEIEGVSRERIGAAARAHLGTSQGVTVVLGPVAVGHPFWQQWETVEVVELE